MTRSPSAEMSPARGECELIAYFCRDGPVDPLLVRPRQKIDHDLAGTRDFAQPGDRRAMARVVQHQVEQLEPQYSAAWAVSGFFVDQRIARLISLPTLPDCSASDSVHHRPRAASACCHSVIDSPHGQ